MAVEGVDYAWDRPNLDTLWAAGKRFTCRYLATLPNGKVLSDGERKALHAKGFGIVLNWEQAAGDMLRGYDVGVRQAREALRQANALGAPPDTPIYFSCDVDTDGIKRLAVAQYLDGCASVLGRQRVGVYGEYDVIDVMVPAHAAWGWQTYAWSGGKGPHPRAHIYQYRNGVQLAGADLDLNRATAADFGAWYPNHLNVQGDDMANTWTFVDQAAADQWRISQNAGRDYLSGQARDTVLAIAAGSAVDASGKLDQVLAAAAADEVRDNAVLAAVKALTVATGGDPAPILDAIEVVRSETHDLVTQLQQQLAVVQARNLKQAQALAAAGVAFELADD